jgi:RimJ/RimL family protein N-acetyltransferase
MLWSVGAGAQGHWAVHRIYRARGGGFRRAVHPGHGNRWRLAREHWGLGYASEAAWTALRFDRLALNEIVSFTADSNLPSQKVMQAIGMHHDPLRL